MLAAFGWVTMLKLIHLHQHRKLFLFIMLTFSTAEFTARIDLQLNCQLDSMKQQCVVTLPEPLMSVHPRV